MEKSGTFTWNLKFIDLYWKTIVFRKELLLPGYDRFDQEASLIWI